MIAKNQIGITTGNLATALKQMLLVSCIPITFSQTKYNGVQAKPNVINCTQINPCQNLNEFVRISLRGLFTNTFRAISGFYLMNQHEDDGGVAEAGFGEEGEGVGVVEKLIAEGPVDGGG